MTDTNTERSDESNPETKERLEEQITSGLSMEEAVENEKIVVMQSQQNDEELKHVISKQLTNRAKIGGCWTSSSRTSKNHD